MGWPDEVVAPAVLVDLARVPLVALINLLDFEPDELI